MMAKRPEDRFQSPGEIVEALAPFTPPFSINPASSATLLSSSSSTSIQSKPKAKEDLHKELVASIQAVNQRSTQVKQPNEQLFSRFLALAAAVFVLFLALGVFLLYSSDRNDQPTGEGERVLAKVRPKIGPTPAAPIQPAPEFVWVDDSPPVGAVLSADGGDAWTWVSRDPTPFSGTLAHQSNISTGTHQHYFTNARSPMTLANGDKLFAYVHLDPANPPSEIMLQWNAGGSWEHRAYWGSNDIRWGTDGKVSRQPIGPLPPIGNWVRLEVPAAVVGLEGKAVNGMAFTLHGGRATWDRAGKTLAAGNGEQKAR
jgi:hypothetical protein